MQLSCYTVANVAYLIWLIEAESHLFFALPKPNERIKILCTSKGVLNEMLLNNKFFKLHPQLKINAEKSKSFEKELVEKVNGKYKLISNPLYVIIESDTGGIIECISTPSSGSPYRKLIDFGFSSENASKFLDDYLNNVFNWFIK